MAGNGQGAANIFQDQGYIVTGAASGIGLATAQMLAARGSRLALWDRNADALEACAKRLNAAHFKAGDVRFSDVVHRMMRESCEKLGQVRGVVHSAGILRTGLFEQIPLSQHARIVEVNLIGSINVAYAALAPLRETGGSLILLGSTSAFYGGAEFASYSATKAGVLALAQALRVEWDGNGVHLGIANPLFVESPMIEGENRRARFLNHASPLIHIYTPEQVAAAILRAMATRRFMIWVGNRPRMIWAMSRYLDWMGHRMMRNTWKAAKG